MNGVLFMVIKEPEDIQLLHKIFKYAGYESFIVGGCVRDYLLGIKPKDWDMCTDALPEDIVRILNGKYRVIETGIKHGTVTVVMPGMQVEITTYRVDGVYSDNRHPDKVEFTKCLEADLSRRDFTINAMAYSLDTGIVDLFGGKDDLLLNNIKCVGNPNKRFQEDALRILRAIRFASRYRFQIDKDTKLAMNTHSHLLNKIAKERIQSELSNAIHYPYFPYVVWDNKEILETVIPEFIPCVKQEQGKGHKYTVFEHLVETLRRSSNYDDIVKWAALLHDIGKPKTAEFRNDDYHFSYHALESSKIANNILSRLRFSAEDTKNIVQLIDLHTIDLADISCYDIKGWLGDIGEKQLTRLLQLRKADLLSRGKFDDFVQREFSGVMETENKLKSIIIAKEPYKISQLKVSGNDIINQLQLPPSKLIGSCLKYLLDLVRRNPELNDKEVLLTRARNHENWGEYIE